MGPITPCMYPHTSQPFLHLSENALRVSSLLASSSTLAAGEALARGEVTFIVECDATGCRKGDRAKDLRLRIESGDESVRASKWENALLCAAGHSPYDLVDSAVAAAAKISGKALLCTVFGEPEA